MERRQEKKARKEMFEVAERLNKEEKERKNRHERPEDMPHTRDQNATRRSDSKTPNKVMNKHI